MDDILKDVLCSIKMEAKNFDTLVLSGGSTKGLIILGAVQCAEDKGLLNNVTNYYGTSAGSIICYLLAIGYSPIEIMVYICTHRLLERLQSFNLISMLNGSGAISFIHIQDCLEKMTLDKINRFVTLKELRDLYGKRLVCSTYNNTKQKMEYISPETHPDFPCLIALRLSSNVPLLFDRFSYMENEYVDGGISDNFPILEAEKIGKRVLGITLLTDVATKLDSGPLKFILALLYVPINQSTLHKISMTDPDKTKVIILDSGTLNNTFTDFNLTSKQKLDMFASGYQSFKDLY